MNPRNLPTHRVTLLDMGARDEPRADVLLPMEQEQQDGFWHTWGIPTAVLVCIALWTAVGFAIEGWMS